jgi:hypothetical protein
MNPVDEPFEEWARRTGMIAGVPDRLTSLATSWPKETRYGKIVLDAMNRAEIEYSRDLLAEIKNNAVPGAICEFGVYEGDWLKIISDHMMDIGLKRTVYGFDSFVGLPPPKEQLDISGFEEGQYAADYDTVYKRLECGTRDIKLIKGWFSETLSSSVALDILQIAYARIDCDLYEPAVQCLEYLEPRLSDNSVLVFDDWSWWFGHGEARAFFEWAERSGLKFEFLAYTSWIHLYLRVKRQQ